MKIMIVGYYGAGNAGDELLLKIIIDRLPKDVEAIVLSVAPQGTAEQHSVASISIYKFEEVLEQMPGCSLVMLGGGGLLHTHNHFKQQGLYHFNNNDISMYVRPILMAKQLGIPTLLWAQGIGPLSSEEARLITKEIFQTATLCSVRDSESSKLIQLIGVTREVMVAPDPVWSYKHHRSILFKPRAELSKKTLLITVRPWSGRDECWKRNLAQAINQSVNPDHFRLLWVPFYLSADANDASVLSDEMAAIEEVKATVNSAIESQTHIATDVSELFHFLSLADYAVCMRMHALILNLLGGTPSLSIEYDTKISRVAIEAGVNPILRLTPQAPAEQWQKAFSCLLDSNTTLFFDKKKINTCVSRAEMHQDYLLSAIQQSEQFSKTTRAPIQKAGFDWLAVWHSTHLNLKVRKLQQDCESQTLEIAAHVEFKQHLLSESQRVRKSLELEKSALIESQQLIERKIDQIVASTNEEHQKLHDQLIANSTQIKSMEFSIKASELALFNTKATWSWRLTRPFRFLKEFFQSPSRALYLAAKTIYWWLPPYFRWRLAKWRFRYINYSRKTLRKTQALVDSSDLCWEDFSEKILTKRSEYQGVFIQEAVIDWNVPLYQRPQHIANALGKAGYLVIYRTHNWSHDNVNGFREVALNVWLSNAAEVDTIQHAMRSIYSTAAVDRYQIKKYHSNNCIVYEYIDHIDPEISGDANNISRLNDQKQLMLSGVANFIVVSAKRLQEEISLSFDASKTVLIPNGVDANHYRRELHDTHILPASYQIFCRRYEICLGYFGALAPWLDYPLIEELAKLRPDVGFVFIGPDYYGGMAKLPVSSNVLCTGAVNYSQLPVYSSLFDICWIPFKAGEIAKTTSPLKLFEYFAMEKPIIVTSDMLECIAYTEVLHANTIQAMRDHIDRAVNLSHQTDFKKRLHQLANSNDWSSRAAQLANIYQSKSWQ